ncbi:MAG: hypothetical protein IPK83_19820 [Planctomycetes bacterium]|nr:hypothetical protein [Planctomycetota bacterium]
MDLISIDIDREFVTLGKWDGRLAAVMRRPVCPPAQGWIDWVRRLGAADRLEAVFRCTHPDLIDSCSREVVANIAGNAGCRWLRFLSNAPISDAGLAAARYLANRTRWTKVISIELCGRLVRMGGQDRRGRIHRFVERQLSSNENPESPAIIEIAREQLCPSLPNEIAERSKARAEESNIGLICLGDDAPRWGLIVAGKLGIANLMIPPNADAWSALGMMIAPIEQCFTRELGGISLGAIELRTAFAVLMDEAFERVTREGYDLDDAESRRMVAFSADGDAQAVQIEFECLLDAKRRQHEWNEALQTRFVDASDSGGMRFKGLKSLQVSVTIFPPTPNWPIDVASPLIRDSE